MQASYRHLGTTRRLTGAPSSWLASPHAPRGLDASAGPLRAAATRSTGPACLIAAIASSPCLQLRARRGRVGARHLVVCASNRGDDFLAPYASSNSGLGRPQREAPVDTGRGTYALVLLNLLAFAADHLLHWRGAQLLYLNHMAPHWWQFVSCCFFHSSWQHISSNLFGLLVFGRYVEEEGGAMGVWLTYLLCGLGGSLASYLSQPGAPLVSLGASGAVFGLFVVSVLTKLAAGLQLRKLIEAAILGNFVVTQVLQEVQAQAAVAGVSRLGGVSHVAHLAGAAAGVLLILLLSRLPDAKE